MSHVRTCMHAYIHSTLTGYDRQMDGYTTQSPCQCGWACLYTCMYVCVSLVVILRYLSRSVSLRSISLIFIACCCSCRITSSRAFPTVCGNTHPTQSNTRSRTTKHTHTYTSVHTHTCTHIIRQSNGQQSTARRE